MAKVKKTTLKCFTKFNFSLSSLCPRLCVGNISDKSWIVTLVRSHSLCYLFMSQQSYTALVLPMMLPIITDQFRFTLPYLPMPIALDN